MAKGSAVALAVILGAQGAVSAQDSYPGVARIVAVGDVHGDLGQFVTVLRQAGLVDDKNQWIGGKAHLVQVGDVLDRGPDSRKVMDLLMELEKQAERAGGRVHALIGNHEEMNLLGDLRYTSPGEYEAFRTGNSEKLRDRAFAAMADSARKTDPEYRKQWDAEHPLGWVEHRLAFGPNGRYGSWIRGHNAVVKIDAFLFLHGGIGPKYADQSPGAINQAVRQALDPKEEAAAAQSIVTDPDGPLWFRGLALGDEKAMEPIVDQVLARFGVSHIVIGHTVTAGTVMTRNEGKVILIDVGMTAAYGGPPACLVIEKGQPFTLHRGHRLELPMGGDPVPYLEAAAALESTPARLQRMIDSLTAAKR